jgi:hypothetical protein
MKYLSFILMSIFLALQATTRADDHSAASRLASHIHNINAFAEAFPQEKVFIHFDNSGYFIGETLWFQAYVVSTADHKATDLSRILYVELLSPAGKVLETRKLKIENGLCHHSFELKPPMLSGYYEVRAYTRYMLNFGDNCIFSRLIPVLNPDDMTDIEQEGREEIDDRSPFFFLMRDKPEKLKSKVNLTFFPEGGHLVDNLPTRIAFKATDETGRSLDVEGVLKNAKGDILATVKTVHAGMGMFQITPSADKKQRYTVEIRHDGKTCKFDIDPAEKHGYTMNILRQNSDAISVLLQRNENTKPDSLGLAVLCRGVPYIFQILSLNDTKLSLKIPLDSLPQGINRLTLFAPDGEILADRQFFINRNKWPKVVATTDKEVYEPFEKIKIKFETFDEDGNPASFPFSYSVRDAATVPDETYMEDARANLLLTSELEGFVERPGWYFDSDAPEKSAALDLLMLTHTWRRYPLQYATGKEKFEPRHWVEKEMLIKGKVLTKNKVALLDRKPCPGMNVNVKMYHNETVSDTTTYRTDNDGGFAFSLPDFEGSRRVAIWVDEVHKDGTTETVERRITLDRQFTPKAKKVSADELAWTKSIHPLPFTSPEVERERSLFALNKLDEVTIKSEKRLPDIIWEVNKEVCFYLDQGLDLPYSEFHSYMRKRDKNYQYLHAPVHENFNVLMEFPTDFWVYKGGAIEDIYITKRGIKDEQDSQNM